MTYAKFDGGGGCTGTPAAGNGGICPGGGTPPAVETPDINPNEFS